MSKPQLSGNVRIVGGNWIARYRLPSGLDTRRKLGPAWTKRGEQPPPGFYDARTARVALDKILSQYEGWTPGSDPIFQFAADEFLEWCEKERKLRGSTLHEYRRLCANRLVPALGRKMLSNISEQDIVSLRAGLAGMSASSINQTKIVLAGIVKYARKKRGYRGDDPSRFFDRAPLKHKAHIDVYSPAEIELLARTVREGWRKEPDRGYASDGKRSLTLAEIAERRRMDDQDAVIFKTAAYAGLRLSEIRALRWRDVDFAGAKITVRSGYTDHGGEGSTKSGKIRTIPLAPQLLTELDHLSRRDFSVGAEDLVFCDLEGEVLSGSAIYHRFQKACAAAGLRKLRLHDLRHSAATMFVQVFPINEVQAMMGHASVVTTMIYLHAIPRHDAANKLGDLISSNLGPQNELNRLEDKLEEDTDTVQA